MTTAIEKVGVIGLGKMGRPMCRHLHTKGFQVIGFDIAPEAVRAVEQLGVKAARSPSEVAASSDLGIIHVSVSKTNRAAAAERLSYFRQ